MIDEGLVGALVMFPRPVLGIYAVFGVINGVIDVDVPVLGVEEDVNGLVLLPRDEVEVVVDR